MPRLSGRFKGPDQHRRGYLQRYLTTTKFTFVLGPQARGKAGIEGSLAEARHARFNEGFSVQMVHTWCLHRHLAGANIVDRLGESRHRAMRMF